MTKTAIIIPSRLNAKRLPDKPLKLINNKEMILHVYEAAIKSRVGEVYVASPDLKIINVIKKFGGNAIQTSENHETGTDRIFEVFNKILKSKPEIIINLQGDMPLINPDHILNVVNPINKNFTIGTLATNLNDNELNNPNVTKVEVDFEKNKVAPALNFYREVMIENKNLYHHVGIYSYTPDSINTFINLPKSKNEIDLSLEQMRAMDSNIPIGVTYVPEVPISVDTKEDLINIETNIREHNDKN